MFTENKVVKIRRERRIDSLDDKTNAKIAPNVDIEPISESTSMDTKYGRRYAFDHGF